MVLTIKLKTVYAVLVFLKPNFNKRDKQSEKLLPK